MEPFIGVAIMRPTQNEKDAGKGSELILEPTCVLAKDQATAIAKLLAKIPEAHQGKEERIDVRVLCFR